jgi:hypothetical protein
MKWAYDGCVENFIKTRSCFIRGQNYPANAMNSYKPKYCLLTAVFFESCRTFNAIGCHLR